MKKLSNRLNICVVTFPRPKAGVIPLSNLVDILGHISDNLSIITGNEGSILFNEKCFLYNYSFDYYPNNNIYSKIFNYFTLQLNISWQILKISKNIDIFLFFMADGLLLPMLTIKSLRKPVVLSLAGSLPHIIDSKNASFFHKITKYFEILNYSLSDRIVIYSPVMIYEWNLNKYISKISIAHEHFLDLGLFKFDNDVYRRNNLIGYIGRFSAEKGILNFVKSIPYILKRHSDFKILLAGEGELKSQIGELLEIENISQNVDFTEWIPHNKLSKYISQLKLIVLPSYTEGLPNIMLEAMACGTPVLVTAVGSIPDIIVDGINGFIMENNSPKCIAKNVVRVLNSPNLNAITLNARKMIENEYSFGASVNNYIKVLKVVKNG